jgi:ketosteroid isomerase-like protein
MTIDDPRVVAEVTAAFHAYEAALMADDVAAMDALFHYAASTVRYGVGEVLYGAEEIRAFRKGRGGSPQRVLGRVDIHSYGPDFATAHAEFFREGSDRRGRQSQSWVRFRNGWKVVSAHVSLEGGHS